MDARPPKRRTSRTRQVLLLALLLVVVLVAALAILEGQAQIGEAWRMYAQVGRRLHPFLQNRAAPYLEGMNEQGFRGETISVTRQPQSFRVFTLGGSTTLGIQNDYADSYPALLQHLLRARYPEWNIEVQNAGGDWYTTAHNLINYQLRVRRYQPDLIVVFEAINDLYRSFSPPWLAHGDFQPDYSHFLGPQIRMLGPQVGFVDGSPTRRASDLLVWRVLRQKLTGQPSPYDSSPQNVQRLRELMEQRSVTEFRSLPSFRQNYELLLRTVREDGVPTIVASQPYLYSDELTADERASLFFAPVFCAEDGKYPDFASMRAGVRQYNDAARELATRHQVPFLDFEAAVPKSAEYFSDDVHLTPAANEILATLVFQWIETNMDLDRDPT